MLTTAVAMLPRCASWLRYRGIGKRFDLEAPVPEVLDFTAWHTHCTH